MDVAAIVVIAAFILLGVFGRTVLTGKEISKLPVLAAEDQFFNNSIRLALPRPRFDPSLFHFHIPFQLYVQKELQHARMPLWNPNFGCGFPTLGELQYCTFSPYRKIFPATNNYLYNLGIVVKSLIAALGTFWICRLFSFSCGASTFAGLAYAISPFVLRELELPNEVQLIPLITAAFLYLCASKSFLKTAILGACTAIALASMHPEFFFLSILNALLTLFVVRAFKRDEKISQITKNILLAGIIGIGLGAPLLLPFFELFSSADSYKFHTSIVQFVDIRTLVCGLITPVCGGGSAFVGIVSILAALFALCCGGKRGASIFAFVVFLTLWASLPGPLEHLAAFKPFSLVPPRYLLAPILLNLCMLSAFGIDLLAEKIEERRWKYLIAFLVGAALLASVPFVLSKGQLNLPGYDGTLPPPAALKPEALKGLISLAIATAAVSAAYLLRFPFKLTVFLPVCLIAANVISMGDASKTSLGPSFPFNFRSTAAIEYLQKTEERMVATGKSFFAPNISMVYGLRDFRVSGPLLPRAITKLLDIREEKEELESRNSVFSGINDLASVRYLLTRWPKYSAMNEELPWRAIPTLHPLPRDLIGGDIFILHSGEYCLSQNGELFTRFVWEPKIKNLAPIATELDIVDKDGKLLAQGQRVPIFSKGKKLAVEQLAVKVPNFNALKADVYAILRIVSSLNEGILPVDGAKLPMRSLGIDLLKISPKSEDITDLSKANLQLVLEDPDGVLVYKNNGALPQAYLSKNILPAQSMDDAAKLLQQPQFNPLKTTIIEASPQQVQLPKTDEAIAAATVSRPDPHSVLVQCKSDGDAFLILTDTFYDGWHAYLDDKEVPILRANLAFRAVKVPAGQHVVKFVFLPHSFYGGLIIAAITALLVVFFAIRAKQKPQA